MNPSRRGVGTGGKVAAVVVLIILGLGAIYLIPKFSPSQSQGAGSNAVPQQITGMSSLIYDFTKMQVEVDVNDPADSFVQNQSYTYAVLGKSTVSSVEYTRAEFKTVGVGSSDVVIWYNSTGGIGEVDVVGVRNYTGNGTKNLPFITTYSGVFGGLVTTTNNATLLSHLSKTSEVLTSIGPTQMNVTTYVLNGKSYPYLHLTLELATIPGTDVQLVTYLDEKTYDGTTTVFQVTSMTR
jgi:hypothetical protein